MTEAKPVDLEYVARDLEKMDSPRAAKKVRACMVAWEEDRRVRAEQEVEMGRIARMKDAIVYLGKRVEGLEAARKVVQT